MGYPTYGGPGAAILPEDVKQMLMAHEVAQKSQAVEKRLHEIMQAMEAMAAPSQNPATLEPATLLQQIKWRIERHQQMIKTLEWFASHVGIDKPEGDLLVDKIIMAGIDSIAERMRKGNPI